MTSEKSFFFVIESESLINLIHFIFFRKTGKTLDQPAHDTLGAEILRVILKPSVSYGSLPSRPSPILFKKKVIKMIRHFRVLEMTVFPCFRKKLRENYDKKEKMMFFVRFQKSQNGEI